VEVWGTLAVLPSSEPGRLESTYQPQLVASPDAAGEARQFLTLDAGAARGFEAGINLFPARHIGVQAFVSRAGADVGGANTPYQVALRYVSRQPPTYDPVEYQLNQSIEWPDTVGRLVQWTAGAGPVVGWRTRTLGVTASGGFVWARLSGDAEPLGFTVFHMGGHAVLFTDDFRVRASFGPDHRVSAFAGGAFDVAVSDHVAANVGLRAIIGGGDDLTTRIAAVVDTSRAGFSPPPVADIDARMAPAPARLSPPRVTLTFGVKIR
jgi:hypothetical protein